MNKSNSPDIIIQVCNNCSYRKGVPRTLQTHHVDSTLKRRGNGRFHVVSTWNPHGVFVGNIEFKLFLNSLDSNTTNITEDISVHCSNRKHTQKITPAREKVLKRKKQV